MPTNGRHVIQRPFPTLPVLGWSAYCGARASPLPGVMNCRYRRYTVSGRAAIALALQVVGVQPGNKVLVPTYHCPTMIAPVVLAGLQPLFYPITASGCPDVNWLQRADFAGVQAMLAAHYFGLPQPMAAIRALCDARGISMIEDCAHAFFGVSDGRPAGGWGDVSIASLTKFFPVPEGGLIVSNTLPLDALQLAPHRWREEIKALADAIEVGVTHDRFPGLNSLLGGVFAVKRWLRRGARIAGDGVNPAQGHASQPPALQRLFSSVRPAYAARWIAENVHLSRIVELRRRNYARLAKLLSGIAGMRVLRAELPEQAAPYVFPLYVDDPVASYPRLRAAGIPIFRWDEIWPGTPVIPADHGCDWATHVFQLGCHQDLSLEDIDAIAATVRGIIQKAIEPQIHADKRR